MDVPSECHCWLDGSPPFGPAPVQRIKGPAEANYITGHSSVCLCDRDTEEPQMHRARHTQAYAGLGGGGGRDMRNTPKLTCLAGEGLKNVCYVAASGAACVARTLRAGSGWCHSNLTSVTISFRRSWESGLGLNLLLKKTKLFIALYQNNRLGMAIYIHWLFWKLFITSEFYKMSARCRCRWTRVKILLMPDAMQHTLQQPFAFCIHLLMREATSSRKWNRNQRQEVRTRQTFTEHLQLLRSASLHCRVLRRGLYNATLMLNMCVIALTNVNFPQRSTTKLFSLTVTSQSKWFLGVCDLFSIQ